MVSRSVRLAAARTALARSAAPTVARAIRRSTAEFETAHGAARILVGPNDREADAAERIDDGPTRDPAPVRPRARRGR